MQSLGESYIAPDPKQLLNGVLGRNQQGISIPIPPKEKIAFDALIKPVYDFSNPFRDLLIDLSMTTQTDFEETTCIPSTSQYNIQTDGSPDTDVFDVQGFITSNDAIPLLHSGDNTDTNAVFTFKPNELSLITKLQMCFAVAIKCSAFVDACKINTVTITLAEIVNSTQSRILEKISINVGQSNLASTISNITQIKINKNVEYTLNPQYSYSLSILTSSTFGASTSQVGFLPMFPFQKQNVPKPFVLSTMKLLYYPQMTNSFRLLRQQDTFDKVDYSGTNQKGIKS